MWIKTYCLSYFDHCLFTAQMLFEVGVGFSPSVVIFSEWNLRIVLENMKSHISSVLHLVPLQLRQSFNFYLYAAAA